MAMAAHDAPLKTGQRKGELRQPPRFSSSNTKDSSKSGEDKSMVAAGDLEEREEK